METDKNNFIDQMRRGRIFSGIILVVIGSLFFARKMGLDIPEWVFTWPMFFVALGFYIGAKHNFKNPGWIILVVFGLIMLYDKSNQDINLKEYFLPALLIGMGLMFIFKPYRGRKSWNKKFESLNGKFDQDGFSCLDATDTNENFVNITAIMGGVKKNVLSKDFKGGEVTCVMGGAEINLIQADINGKANLEINNILGGTKLILPANWEVVSEVMVVLGGIEDKRPMMNERVNASEKTLIIKGSCIFGGIDIRSY